MASLDKAFIKAYRQQGPAVGAISLDTSGTDSLVEALEDRPLREAKKQSAEARHSGVLAVLGSERLRTQPPAAESPVRKPASGRVKQEPDAPLCNGEVPSFLRRSKEVRGLTKPSRAVVDLAGVLEVERTVRIDPAKSESGGGEPVVPSPHIHPPQPGPPHLNSQPMANADATEPSASVPSPGNVAPGSIAPGSVAPGNVAPGNVASGSVALEPEASRIAASEAKEVVVVQAREGAAEVSGGFRECADQAQDAVGFRPALQVEQIALSLIGERLQRIAVAELDRLGDALLSLGGKGRRIVALAADRRGQGATTLLSCVALRLAERRLRIAVVDANVENPQLATEFGLLPECGWERMLEEPTELEELIIESTQQSIALLPLCASFEPSCAEDFEPFGEAVATLKDHYDLVLVDLGVPGHAVISRAARVFDSVLLVRDVRRAQPDRGSDLYRTLVRAGVNVAGVIESFVSVG